jgi:hypothetical protein
MNPKDETASEAVGDTFTVTASGASLNAPNNSQTADQILPTVAKLGKIGAGHPYCDPKAYAPVTAVRFGRRAAILSALLQI